jgi:amidase
VICPSSINGIVGIKPTLGLVSRAGIIPIAHTQDTAGPMCRTVRDAAILLSALAGVDPRDKATAAATGKLHDNYTQFLDPAGLKGARIGVGRVYFGQRPDVDKAAEENLAALRAAGAEVIEIDDLFDRSAFGKDPFQVLLYEFKTDLDAYLAGLGPSVAVKALADVIEFNEKNADREMPFFDQSILLEAEKKGPLTEPAYRKALARVKKLSQAGGIDRAIEKYRIDAIVAPSAGPAWVTDLINGDNGSGGSSGLAAMAGYPHITVPGGFIRGLPVGFSFFGPAWSEPTLLKLAYAFEQQTQHREPPRFLPTLALA